jgi:hypothetical protein
MTHETEICRIEREGENNVLVLLSQMYNGDSCTDIKDVSVTKGIVDQMIGSERALERALKTNEKMSSLELEVQTLQGELVQLRSGGASSVFMQDSVGSRPRPTGSVKKQRRVTIIKAVEEK